MKHIQKHTANIGLIELQKSAFVSFSNITECCKEGTFVYLPISNTYKITELFRRLVIKYFQEKKLINEQKALEFIILE